MKKILTVILLLIPGFTFANTGDLIIEKQVNNYIASHSGEIFNNVVSESQINKAIEEKNGTLDLKKEVVDSARKDVDWWLMVLAIIFSALGISGLFFGFFGYKKLIKEIKQNFEKREDELKEQQEQIKKDLSFTQEFSRAMAMLAGKRFELAELLFKDLLKGGISISNKVYCYFHLGILYSEKGNENKAILEYDKALVLDYKNYMAIRNKSNILIRQEKYIEAEKLVKEGLGYYPNDAELLEALKSITKHKSETKVKGNK